jgi:hypothetical protein
VPRAFAQPIRRGGGDLPLWTTSCIYAESGMHDVSSVSLAFQSAQNDPYANYLNELFGPDVSEEVRRYEMTAQNPTNEELTSEEMEAFQTWSTAKLGLIVERIPSFYELNFMLVLVLLVLVSFFSFSLPVMSLDARLSLTLTVVLGLNVFQIVVIDNVPATGYRKYGCERSGVGARAILRQERAESARRNAVARGNRERRGGERNGATKWRGRSAESRAQKQRSRRYHKAKGATKWLRWLWGATKWRGMAAESRAQKQRSRRYHKASDGQASEVCERMSGCRGSPPEPSLRPCPLTPPRY